MVIDVLELTLFAYIGMVFNCRVDAVLAYWGCVEPAR